MPVQGLDEGRKTGDRTSQEPGARDWGIANAAVTHAGRGEAGLSLLFAPGSRPTAADVVRLAGAAVPSPCPTGFAVSHRPEEPATWLELLASGLTFDLAGLAPGEAVPLDAPGTMIGMPRPASDQRFEPVELVPGPHLAGGEAILPIVRVHVALAARLTELPGVSAVAWHPARTWIEPGAFVRMVSAWLEGGAFPALGLTALSRSDGGGLITTGLAFFVGRELRMEPGLAENAAEAAKLAVRLIHHIVETGRDEALGPQVTADGLGIIIGESGDGRFLEVRRDGL